MSDNSLPQESASDSEKGKSAQSDNRENPSKAFPFTAEHFLKAISEATTRTRGILLIIIFTSIIILMALVNSFSPNLSWFSSKTQLFNDISQHICFDTQSEAKVKFDQYIEQNEALNSTNAKLTNNENQILKIIKNKYQPYSKVQLLNPSVAPIYDNGTFEDRCRMYERLGKAIQYVYTRQIINKRVIDNYADKLYAAEVEHIMLVRVPILGVTFHVNFLSTFSGLTLMVLFILLYMSLKREHINTKIAFRRGWDYIKKNYHHFYYYEYLSMFHVLIAPKKLFVKQTRTRRRFRLFSMAAIYFPIAIYIMVVGYDIYTLDIGFQLNDFLTYLTPSTGIAFLITLIWLSSLVNRYWLKIERMWDYQALEFNFECIIEKIEKKKKHETEFTELTSCNLTENNLTDVKKFWYKSLSTFFNSGKKLNEKNSFIMYANFINHLLEAQGLKPDDINISDETQRLDKYWDSLKHWYNTYGKKVVTSTFKDKFVEMINDLRIKYEQDNSPSPE